jgi:hypothetical protein
MSSLCFQEAFVRRRDNDITEDEFIEALVDHCTGIRHGSNRLCNNDAALPEKFGSAIFATNVVDQFTWGVAQWIFFHFKSPVTGTALYSL